MTLNAADVTRQYLNAIDGLSVGMDGGHEILLIPAKNEHGMIEIELRCTHGDFVGELLPNAEHIIRERQCTGPHERHECRVAGCTNEVAYPTGYCAHCEDAFA